MDIKKTIESDYNKRALPLIKEVILADESINIIVRELQKLYDICLSNQKRQMSTMRRITNNYKDGKRYFPLNEVKNIWKK